MNETLHLLLFLLVMLLLHDSCRSQFGSRTDGQKRQNKRKLKGDKPNIVVIMTDDQDVLLGSMQVMPKTLRIMRDQGLEFNNSFVSTPMCCPSRTTFFTGLYAHNHHVYTNHDNCTGQYWHQHLEPLSFAKYLNNAGYRTGYFGKYLNNYNGSYIPPGWREWVGLIRNSRFYNYSINFNGNKIKHNDNYYADYLTDLIANDSVTFLKQSKQYFKKRPVLMVLSTPAPHGPEDAAPQYQHLFYNNTFHRTRTWNMAPNLDKQYLLKITQKMEPIHQKFTDVLQQKRLQTLQSVDDLVEKVYNELWALGELDNTYIIYTSDHGYHLGQYGIIKGKGLPYDFDVRVPLYIRGPGIRARTKVSNMALNVDLAPTILDMAGVDIPEHMDGTSLMKVIRAYRSSNDVDEDNFVETRKPWRDSVLLERGKITEHKVKVMMREQTKTFMESISSMNNIPDYLMQIASRKQRKILRVCKKQENIDSPCEAGERVQCIYEQGKMPKLEKCPRRVPGCICNNRIRRSRNKRDRGFLRGHRRRMKRVRRSYLEMTNQRAASNGSILRSLSEAHTFERRCRALPNKTIACDQELYNDPDAWRDHKGLLDEMIKEYRKMLEDLRAYRRHLKISKPRVSYLSSVYDSESGEDNDIDEEGYSLGHNPAEEDCICDEDELKSIRRQQRRDRRRRKKNKRKVNDCNQPNMNCQMHNNEDWQTPPLWDSDSWDLPPDQTIRRKNHPACRRGEMGCALMDNSHWKTPPYWNNGPFCYCTSSNNNTYWCLRTINQTHDLLYCEFINNFISYYDLREDPFQEKNAIHKVNYGILQQLHDQLNLMRACKGTRECTKAGINKDILRQAQWRNSYDNIDDDDDDGDDYMDDDL